MYARADAKFSEDVREMRLNRAFAQNQLLGDAPVGKAFGDHPRDLCFFARGRARRPARDGRSALPGISRFFPGSALFPVQRSSASVAKISAPNALSSAAAASNDSREFVFAQARRLATPCVIFQCARCQERRRVVIPEPSGELFVMVNVLRAWRRLITPQEGTVPSAPGLAARYAARWTRLDDMRFIRGSKRQLQRSTPGRKRDGGIQRCGPRVRPDLQRTDASHNALADRPTPQAPSCDAKSAINSSAIPATHQRLLHEQRRFIEFSGHEAPKGLEVDSISVRLTARCRRSFDGRNMLGDSAHAELVRGRQAGASSRAPASRRRGSSRDRWSAAASASSEACQTLPKRISNRTFRPDRCANSEIASMSPLNASTSFLHCWTTSASPG